MFDEFIALYMYREKKEYFRFINSWIKILCGYRCICCYYCHSSRWLWIIVWCDLNHLRQHIFSSVFFADVKLSIFFHLKIKRIIEWKCDVPGDFTEFVDICSNRKFLAHGNSKQKQRQSIFIYVEFHLNLLFFDFVHAKMCDFFFLEVHTFATWILLNSQNIVRKIYS